MNTSHIVWPQRGPGLLGRPRLGPSRPPRVTSVCLVACASDSQRSSSRKGKQFENDKRRRGRPAWLRTPYDSPLRDGNRDRLIGLLTERAAKTLMVYLMETNPTTYHWLVQYYKENPIPKNGSWDDVSGETFLRKLLAMPVMDAKLDLGRESLFDNMARQDVDPRSMAQRIMDIRSQLAEEFVQDLKAIGEENNLLLRETLSGSLSMEVTVEHPCDKDGPPPSAAAGNQPPLRPHQRNDATLPPADRRLRASFRPRRVVPSRPLEPLDGSSSSSSSQGISPAEKASLVARLSAAFSQELSVAPGDTAAGLHPEVMDSLSSSEGSTPMGSSEEEAANNSSSGQGLSAAGGKAPIAAAAAAVEPSLPMGWGPRDLPERPWLPVSPLSSSLPGVARLQNNIIKCSSSSLTGSSWPTSSEEEEVVGVDGAPAVAEGQQ